MAYIFDPIRNTFVDDEDTSLGNKLALNDEEFEKLLKIPGVFRASEAVQPPQRPDVQTIEAINRFVTDNPRDQKANGGRVNLQDGLGVMTLDPFKPTINPIDSGSLENVLGTGIPIVGGASLLEKYFKKKAEEDKKDTDPNDKNILKKPDPKDPKNLEDLASSIEIAEAVERLKKKEMDVTKRDNRTALARELDLPVTKSGLYEIRKGDFFDDRLKTLKEKGVNFDGYYSTREIANLLGIKTNAGVIDFINRKEVPTVKTNLYNVVKLNDFLTAYKPTKERIEKAPPTELGTLARTDFLKEVGGSSYQRFKDIRAPKKLPKNVKNIYEKYDLGEIEGGHPFPVEFFTKKFGKGKTLQKDRQFDWIYRNKDKLFDKNDLVFQSKEINTLYRNKINELKKYYKELGPLVDKYEGKGPVTNEKDIKTIESLNNKIMDIVAKSEFDAKEFIAESSSPFDLKRMSKGGLRGAIFTTDNGEVSLYAPGKEAGFVEGSVGKIETEEGAVSGEKLKLAGDYLDIINQVITDEEDKKIFADFINKKLLPKFKTGGGVNITPLPRIDFGKGGATGMSSDEFVKELEYYFTNPDADLPKATTFRETMNPIEILNDMIDPRNYPYYADRVAKTGIRIGEFGLRVLPAVGKLIGDVTTKPSVKIEDKTGTGYIQDYDQMPKSRKIKGTGIFSEFLDNLIGTEMTEGISRATGLDDLIKMEEQKMMDRRTTAGPKVLADTATLGMEFTAPIFPGLKLLKSYAKARKLPVDDTTKELLEKEIKDTLDKNGISRRDFMKTAGAGASLVIAKMLGFGDEFTKATKVVRPTVEQTATGGVPPYFFELVKKIKKSGRTLEPEFDPRVENNMQLGDYVMRENTSTGEISIQKVKEGGMNVGDEVMDGVISEETITYKPGEFITGADGKPVRTADEYEEFTTKPDINDDGKMKDVEPGLDSIEEIIELMPNQLKRSELEAAGYNVEAFPDNIKKLLIDDLQKID